MSDPSRSDVVAEVRGRASIVEVVSRYTQLRRTGRNHMGLCPFHDEKTPSFSVSEDRGLFHCFGCGVSGDVFKFVMQKESVTFPEALERLAREFGVELPKREEDRTREEGRERLLRVNAFAQRWFERALWNASAGTRARAYLDERGFSGATARAFGLGYAPADGLASALERAGAPLADAEALGLIGRSTRGEGWFDRFRDRLMFPIHDLGGKVIGFGGRVLVQVDGQPKYLNSSESAIFQKRRSLFGLGRAREAIRDSGRAIVVEGYLDAIALAQAGIGSAVAPLGTALTADQVRLLKRFAERIVVCFDGDEAGLRAGARSFETFAEVGVFADGAFLPAGEDPDSWVRQHGRDGMEEILARATSLVDHYLRSLATPDAPLPVRARAAGRVTELLERTSDAIFRGFFAHRAAEFLGIAEEALRRGRRRTFGAHAPQAPAQPAAAGARLSDHESMIVELLLVHPRLVAELPGSVESLFPEGPARELFAKARAPGADAEPGDILAALSSESRDRVARALLGETEIYPEPSRMLADTLAKLARAENEARKRALSERIRTAEVSGDGELLVSLLTEKKRLDEETERLRKSDTEGET